MTVAYDGTDFRGFAANRGVATVGGTLAEAIGRVLGQPVELACAGRTDAGVHAWGQVISFDAPAAGLDVVELGRAVTKLCGGPIVVREAAVAEPDFHARFSAVSRRYRYTVDNAPVPDPFTRRFTWHVETPLDLERMRLGCDPLIGSHDFSSFCRAPKVRADQPPASLVRRVRRRPVGSSWATASCASRSRPTPSATRWCAAWWARWSTSDWAGAAQAR